MRLLFLYILLLSFPLGALTPDECADYVFENAITPHEGWESTNFSEGMLTYYVNSKKARRNESTFLQSVAALNTLTILSFGNSYFVPHQSLTPGASMFGAKLAQLPLATSLPLFSDPNSSGPFSDLRENVREEWRKAYRAGNARLDIDAAMSWALKNVRPVSLKRLLGHALENYFSEADPHALIFPKEILAQRRRLMAKSVNGFPVELRQTGNEIWVYDTFSLAEAMGVRRNDTVIAVGGKPARTLHDTSTELQNAPDGVVLSVARDGQRIDLPLQRSEFYLHMVQSFSFDWRGKRMGYIRADDFDSLLTVDDWANAIGKLNEEKVSGIIVDLRDNPGGLIATVTDVAGLFLGPDKSLGEMREFGGKVQPLQTKVEKMTDVPLVLVVDSSTQSAAEHLAAILQFHSRAWVVGETTWGKGVFQQTMNLVGDYAPLAFAKVDLRLTSGMTFLPSGRSYHGYGVIPQFHTFIKPLPAEEDIPTRRERHLHGAVVNTGPPALPPYRPELDALTDCIAEKGIADQLYENATRTTLPRDYQLLYAADLMNCL